MSAFKTGWYVIYTKNRHERKVAEQLERVGVEYFLPCINAVRQWYDRKKIISVPLFPSYIFVKIKDNFPFIPQREWYNGKMDRRIAYKKA